MTVKSQDDLGQRGRSVDVLTSTIDELAKVKKQLKIAVEMLKYYGNEDKWTDCHSNWADCDTLSCLCDYGYKFAQEALKQIKELDK